MESEQGRNGAPSTVAVVVPCYNEEKRLDLKEVEKLLLGDGVEVILVDDGSSDGTRGLLESCANQLGPRVMAHALDENHGKAEAVRAGLRLGIARGADAVGYLDADMSTSPEEMLALIELLRNRNARVVLGSRVRLLGHDVQRSAPRHYLGRLFATAASLILDLPVYDTQCGAKVFRADERFRAAIAEPFSSRWAFDVELLSRLTAGPDGLTGGELLEVPLQRWEDRGGSKLGLVAMLGAGVDLLRIAMGREESR
jgi:glycosyltransferase involved in cell wall biosynthesis